MINKHLLQTRLKSVAHYNAEIDALNLATTATEETRLSVLNSIAEFFPYKAGDVLVLDKNIIRVVEFQKMEGFSDPAFVFTCEEHVKVYSQTKWVKSDYKRSLKVSDLEKVKVLDSSIFE